MPSPSAARRLPWLVGAAALAAGTPAFAGPGGNRGAAGVLAFSLGALILAPSLTALGLLLMALVPGTVNVVRDAVVQGRGRCVRAGIVALAVTLFLVAASRGGGGVVAVLALVFLALALAVGIPAVGLLLGQSVLQHAWPSPNALASAAVGLSLLFLAAVVPVVGWGLFLFLCLMALGGVVVAVWDRRARRRAASRDAGEPPLPTSPEVP